MVYGIGVDMVEIARMTKSMEKPHFVERVFGGEEWAVLQNLPPHRRRESAAACFAAKEAFLKAAGTGLGGFALHELSSLRKETGAPYYLLSGRAREFCEENGLIAHLSLSHEGGYAIAMAVLERTDERTDGTRP